MMLSLGNLFHKWYAPYARETQFDTLAGKLPEDIVNKIMGFWSPGYPFLDELKLVYMRVAIWRRRGEWCCDMCMEWNDVDDEECDTCDLGSQPPADEFEFWLRPAGERWKNGIIRGVISTTHKIRRSSYRSRGRWDCQCVQPQPEV